MWQVNTRHPSQRTLPRPAHTRGNRARSEEPCCTASAAPPTLSPPLPKHAYMENHVSMDTVERAAKKGGGDEDTGSNGAASAPPRLRAAPIVAVAPTVE